MPTSAASRLMLKRFPKVFPDPGDSAPNLRHPTWTCGDSAHPGAVRASEEAVEEFLFCERSSGHGT